MASELPKSLIGRIDACDLSECAQQAFAANVELNDLAADARINFLLDDTKHVMLRTSYDVVDLDPYGSAVPFLFHALSALGAPGFPGLLCVTFTDSKVLCGSDRHKCYYDYGVVHGGSDCEEEQALRSALYTVSRVAAMQCKAVRVLLCVQSEFYIRLFLEVELSRQRCCATLGQHGLLLGCRRCGVVHAHRFGRRSPANGLYLPEEWALPEGRCAECQGQFKVNGPLWTDALYDPDFVAALRAQAEKLDTEASPLPGVTSARKILALFNAVAGEMALKDDPRTFSFVKLFRRKGMVGPGCKAIYSALRNHGFAFAPSYVNRYCFKTDAPVSFLLQMVAEWRKAQQDRTHQSAVDFSRNAEVVQLLDSMPPKFLPNPEKNWGPKAASKIQRAQTATDKKAKVD